MGNLRMLHINSVDFPGKLWLFLQSIWLHLKFYFWALLEYQAFKSLTVFSQGADSSSETVQLQYTVVSEQQAGAAGPNSKVPQSSLPLHREYAASSQPGLESPNCPVRIQASVSLLITHRLSGRHVSHFTNLFWENSCSVRVVLYCIGFTLLVSHTWVSITCAVHFFAGREHWKVHNLWTTLRYGEGANLVFFHFLCIMLDIIKKHWRVLIENDGLPRDNAWHAKLCCIKPWILFSQERFSKVWKHRNHHLWLGQWRGID